MKVAVANVGFRASQSEISITDSSPILPTNRTGQQFSKKKVGNEGPSISGQPREQVLVNGWLQEVHVGACQQSVVDFMFAAIAVFR